METTRIIPMHIIKAQSVAYTTHERLQICGLNLTVILVTVVE